MSVSISQRSTPPWSYLWRWWLQWSRVSCVISSASMCINIHLKLRIVDPALRKWCETRRNIDMHNDGSFVVTVGWVGLWGFLWWAPSAERKDHHGVSFGWNSVWHRSNTGLSSTQYEQIPIIIGVWPFWLTPLFFRSITFWEAYG